MSYSNKVIRAGNEGETHLNKKINTAIELYHTHKHLFKNKHDGIYLEYPLSNLEINENNYAFNSTKYYDGKLYNIFLSLLKKSQIINNENQYQIKNLHNIFNSNLRLKKRRKRNIFKFKIIKIVDIAVVIDSKILKIVEIVLTSKMSEQQKADILKYYPNLIICEI